MKVIYDPAVDILTIILTETEVFESNENNPGIILDYDDKGNLVSFEILDASRRMSVPSKADVIILNEFNALTDEARKQAKEARLKPRDIASAVAKARGRK
jgi:uncharacterized protein YuzE